MIIIRKKSTFQVHSDVKMRGSNQVKVKEKLIIFLSLALVILTNLTIIIFFIYFM